jgi:hypothetical protein
MYNSNMPTNEDLPSTGKLIKSTILAAIAAGVLLVTVVMPSEYGIDPTGVGKMLGLTDMGEIKTELAQEAAADAIAHSPEIETAPEPEATPTQPEQSQGHSHGDGSYHHH